MTKKNQQAIEREREQKPNEAHKFFDFSVRRQFDVQRNQQIYK